MQPSLAGYAMSKSSLWTMVGYNGVVGPPDALEIGLLVLGLPQVRHRACMMHISRAGLLH